MKHLYSFLFIWLITATATLASGLIAPPDTVPGHARAVQAMSATLCTKLSEEDQRRSLANLSLQEAKALLTQLMMSTMGEHAALVTPMFAGNANSRSIGERIGQDVVLKLAHDCPVAQQLVMRVGMNEVKDKLPSVNESEKEMLSTISSDICQRIDKQNAEAPLEKRSKEERHTVITTAIQQGMLAHYEDLSSFYGAKVIQKKGVMGDIGKKIAILMSEQCPSYLMQLGLDQKSK